MAIPEFKRILKLTPAGNGDFSYQADKYIGGNKLTLLPTGGEAYRSMWDAIEGAKETVHLETYIFSSDKTGQEFARRLEAQARKGVRVRVIFDAVGSLDIDQVFLTRMRNAGVQLLEYHPVAPWRPRWTWTRRDHRKLLVVDGKVAFTGGVNISDEHAPIAEGGSDWHDVHVRLEGPAAYQAERLFRSVWFKETQRWFASEGHPDHLRGESKVWVAANEEFLHRYRIRSAYLSALRAAAREVRIANAYFSPDLPTRLALSAAAKRGVSVRVLVQGRTDITSIWYAGRYHYDYLLRHDVRLFEWMGTVLHSKTALIDRQWASVGSYNMDRWSLLHNLEVNLNILDPDFAAQLNARFEGDMSQAREIKLDEWRRRPAFDKIAEAVCYLLTRAF
ncbi:MAG: phospholipase D-like domain-containing protein [Elusimicrobiota bacterium]